MNTGAPFNTSRYRTILGLAFVLMVIVFLTSGSFILILGTNLQEDVENIEMNYTESVRLVGQIQISVNYVRILIRDLIISQSLEEQLSIKSQIDSVTTSVTRLLDEYEPKVTLKAEMDNYDEYRKTFSDYLKSRSEIISAVDSGRHSEATELLRTKLTPHRNRLESISERLLQANREAAQSVRLHIDELESQFRLTSIFTVITSLVLLSVIYIYTTKNTQYYIRELVNADNEKKILIQSLQKRQTQIEQLILSLTTIEDDQRKRFAFELHDAIGHGLTAAQLTIDSALQRLAEGKSDVWDSLTIASKTIQETLSEVKQISYELRPMILDDFGLEIAIQQLLHDFQRRTGITTETDFFLATPRLPARYEINIYRIVQEALTNIEKHARAKNVSIQLLLRDDGNLALSLSDNGFGFAMQKSETLPGKQFGLLNINERTKLLGGTCIIDSSPGKGTEISIEIPITQGT
ncbi:MAG: MCP four helix bundle domain-containing protein [Ignavibacteriales bacterium]|nr:MCP four helix bundle domain-containing protein [Ignavibacteriales bacterium]